MDLGIGADEQFTPDIKQHSDNKMLTQLLFYYRMYTKEIVATTGNASKTILLIKS